MLAFCLEVLCELSNYVIGIVIGNSICSVLSIVSVLSSLCYALLVLEKSFGIQLKLNYNFCRKFFEVYVFEMYGFNK